MNILGIKYKMGKNSFFPKNDREYIWTRMFEGLYFQINIVLFYNSLEFDFCNTLWALNMQVDMKVFLFYCCLKFLRQEQCQLWIKAGNQDIVGRFPYPNFS